MQSDFEFDSIAGGDWVKGRDHVGEWVFIRVRDISTRINSFTGESEFVMEADWAFDLLGEGSSSIEKGLMISGFIARACRGKRNLVGKIGQTVPKQKGFQGAFILEQPEGPELAQAQARARALIEAEGAASKPAPKAVAKPDTSEQELQDLLAEL